MDPSWFAIWTRSRHEKIVRDQIAKRTDVDVFLPTIGKWSRWKDRKKKIEWPLFPGYVFARFVPDERIGILKVDGVVQIISNNGMLSPIPDEEIDSIRTLIVLSFAGLGWYAYEVQGVRDFSQIPPVLITVTSYLLGVFARGLFTWGRGSSPAQPPIVSTRGAWSALDYAPLCVQQSSPENNLPTERNFRCQHEKPAQQRSRSL